MEFDKQKVWWKNCQITTFLGQKIVCWKSCLLKKELVEKGVWSKVCFIKRTSHKISVWLKTCRIKKVMTIKMFDYKWVWLQGLWYKKLVNKKEIW